MELIILLKMKKNVYNSKQDGQKYDLRWLAAD